MQAMTDCPPELLLSQIAECLQDRINSILTAISMMDTHPSGASNRYNPDYLNFMYNGAKEVETVIETMIAFEDHINGRK